MRHTHTHSLPSMLNQSMDTRCQVPVVVRSGPQSRRGPRPSVQNCESNLIGSFMIHMLCVETCWKKPEVALFCFAFSRSLAYYCRMETCSKPQDAKHVKNRIWVGTCFVWVRYSGTQLFLRFVLRFLFDLLMIIVRCSGTKIETSLSHVCWMSETLFWVWKMEPITYWWNTWLCLKIWYITHSMVYKLISWCCHFPNMNLPFHLGRKTQHFQTHVWSTDVGLGTRPSRQPPWKLICCPCFPPHRLMSVFGCGCVRKWDFVFCLADG